MLKARVIALILFNDAVSSTYCYMQLDELMNLKENGPSLNNSPVCRGIIPLRAGHLGAAVVDTV
jgi:hypothetical protein